MMDKQAMYQLTYGLFILTAKEGGKDNGCIVNMVTQVTTDPNRIMVAVNKNNLTHDMIVNTGVFNTDYGSGNITYKTYILDNIGTSEEPDLYVLDFGYNDYIYKQGLDKMNYDSLPD